MKRVLMFINWGREGRVTFMRNRSVRKAQQQTSDRCFVQLSEAFDMMLFSLYRVEGPPALITDAVNEAEEARR